MDFLRKQVVIAEGTTLNELPQYERLLEEGSRGEVRIYLPSEGPIPDTGRITAMENNLIKAGVTLTEPIKIDARILTISFEKRLTPLVLIAAVVGAIVASYIGWQLLKTVIDIPLWVALAGGAILGWFIYKGTR